MIATIARRRRVDRLLVCTCITVSPCLNLSAVKTDGNLLLFPVGQVIHGRWMREHERHGRVSDQGLFWFLGNLQFFEFRRAQPGVVVGVRDPGGRHRHCRWYGTTLMSLIGYNVVSNVLASDGLHSLGALIEVLQPSVPRCWLMSSLPVDESGTVTAIM
jgi:hypothetical protein